MNSKQRRKNRRAMVDVVYRTENGFMARCGVDRGTVKKFFTRKKTQVRRIQLVAINCT